MIPDRCPSPLLKMRKRIYVPLSRNSGFIESKCLDDTPVALIHNIVGTTQIESSVKPINLLYISKLLPHSFYDRHKFAAITIRISNPNCTALLFTSGKLVLTGAKSWHECVLASLCIVKMLKTHVDGVDFYVKDTKIQNIVGNVEIPMQPNQYLDLDHFFTTYNEFVTYQKNMFPGLIFRPDNSPVVLLCFFSGKIVITGGKCVDDIQDGWTLLWPKIKQFIK